MVIYRKQVSEPWFSLLKLKIKKVEGRLNTGDFCNIKIGDFFMFINNENRIFKYFIIEVLDIKHYINFHSYLENEKLERCLPSITNINDGLNIYYKYYTKSDEEKYGVKAFIFG